MDSGKISYKDIPPSVIVEGSLDRVTAFVNTNGMIQVTLCGLFATTIAVLVALAESDNIAAKNEIYAIIIPAFSLVIFAVALNVYSWIDGQLEYLAKYGSLGEDDGIFLTYEQSTAHVEALWLKEGEAERFKTLLLGALRFYLTIPTRMNNIYCYYFLLYTVSPFLTLWMARVEYDFWKSAGIIVLVQILSVRMGWQDAVKRKHLSNKHVNAAAIPDDSSNEAVVQVGGTIET